MSIKKTLQNKNKKRFTKEEYKYIESVWNVKNYITGQHHFLVNFAPMMMSIWCTVSGNLS